MRVAGLLGYGQEATPSRWSLTRTRVMAGSSTKPMKPSMFSSSAPKPHPLASTFEWLSFKFSDGVYVTRAPRCQPTPLHTNSSAATTP